MAGSNSTAGARHKAGLSVTGDTYPVKEQLKAAGCLWHPESKTWVAPNEQIRDVLQYQVSKKLLNPLRDASDEELKRELNSRGYGGKTLSTPRKKRSEAMPPLDLEDPDLFDVKV